MIEERGHALAPFQPVATQLLYESTRTRVLRCELPGLAHPVVVKQALNPDASARLKHEIELLKKLANTEGVVELADVPPGSLGHDACLAMCDRGGVSLAETLTQRPADIGEVLRLSLALARTLARLHAAGVVHKDINPTNIIVGGSQPQPILIDFGISSSVAEQQPGFTHQSRVMGTLAYMAPEQTGRTGRSVDWRSDLYSLGVTMYEMVVGRKPFGGDDLLDVIHAHLVQVPPDPATLSPSVPPMLSAVIMRLIEKEPDLRYQSAAGLAHDLEQLLHAVQHDETTAAFELGRQDFAPRLAAPSRLVGREHEIRALDQALDRCRDGHQRCLLIGGPPGVGKTALINELRALVTARRGWFVAAKFDQYRKETFGALHEAMSALGRLLLAEPEDRLAEYRERLLQGLGINAGFSPALPPEFMLLLGEHPPVDVTDPRLAEARTVQATLDLLRSVASAEHPVVMVLDDLQWAPAMVLHLLDAVVTSIDKTPGLLLVGAYRANELDTAHSLASSMARWRNLDLAPPQVLLVNLSAEHVGTLIERMLRLSVEDAALLAAAISDRADGNPLDTVELINALRHDGLLTLGHGRWCWDDRAVRSHVGNTDVVALLVRRINRLPVETQDLLVTIACLGGDVSQTLLQAASAMGGSLLERALMPALQDGMLIIDQGDNATLRFRHDRVQQAVLERVGSERRNLQHLMLARRLEARPELASKAAEQYLPAIESGSFSLGESERRCVAVLFQKVASRLRASNFSIARRMCAAAVVLLQDIERPADNQLMLQLEIQLHAALFGLARMDEVDRLYAGLARRSQDRLNIVDAACVQVGSLLTRSQFKEALDLGLHLLAELGLPKPRNSKGEAEIALKDVAVWAISPEREEDFHRPSMSDPLAIAHSKLLTCVVVASRYLSDGEDAWAASAGFRLWVEQGPTEHLSLCIGHGARLLAEIGRNCRGAHKMLRHNIAIAEARDFGVGTPFARLAYGFAGHLVDPIEHCVRAFHKAREELAQSGESVYVMQTFRAIDLQLDCAGHIEVVASELDSAIAFCKSIGNSGAVERASWRKQAIDKLRGVTGSGRVDWPDAIAIARSPGTQDYHLQICRSWMTVATAIFNFSDFDGGVSESTLSHSMASVPLGVYVAVIAGVLSAVHRAGRARTMPEAQRTAALRTLRGDLQWVVKRAEDAPMNFLHLQHWLEAELAWTSRDNWTACAAFETAIVEAEKHHRPWHHALITERAGRFHLAHGHERHALGLITQARVAYDAWGAAGKVRALEQEFEFLRQAMAGRKAITASDSLLAGDMVDMTAVVRASQALSSQTHLRGLTEQLGKVLCSMTGATDVHLLVRADDQAGWLVCAPESDSHLVVTLDTAGERGELPASLLRYLERTRQVLVLDDAKQDSRFAGDRYFAALKQCSVLATPIVVQNELRAMLFLQNRRRCGAFSPQGLDAVNLIAGQLAVSLDNATLYASLERKVADRTAELADANARLQRVVVEREGELRTATALKAALVDHALAAVLITDPAGTVVEFNPAAHATFGLSREQALGLSCDRLVPGLLEALRDKPSPALGLRRILTGLRADGSAFPIEAVLWCVDTEGTLHYAVSLRDITEQQRDAQTIERLRDALRQGEKLTAMGSLLAEVAHELNNPLAVAMGRAGMIEESTEGTPLHNDAKRVREAVMRCARIVRTFLNMARQRPTTRSAVQLNDLVRGATDVLAYTLRTHGVQVKLSLDPDLPEIQVDADQVGQVVLNLIVNAQHAMAGIETTRRLSVQTGCTETAAHQASPAGVEPRVWLRVQDSGPGVPSGLRERIFEAFFTTKPDGAGTGLGLSVSRSIARSHGGDLTLEPGTDGATFTLNLPLSSEFRCAAE
jgi:PAS domain S-box-containing protein